MEANFEINTLDISSILTQSEKLLFTWVQQVISQVKCPEDQKIIYGCGGWVRDKLFFVEGSGTDKLKKVNKRFRFRDFE